MISRYFRKLLIPLSALAIILACNGPFAPATPQPAATLDALYTSAAQTLESMSTQGAYYTFTPPSAATDTLSILLPTSTSTSNALATYTTVPQLPPVTRCDAASFIGDVTYPDGSIPIASACGLDRHHSNARRKLLFSLSNCIKERGSLTP